MAEHPTAEDYARAQDTLDFLVGMVEAEALARRCPRPDGHDIPCTVIAGFLGAGKTTLMRHLLTARHGLKVAALVNDFAALDIDAGLIADVTGDTVALANGCICCSQSGGAARALTEIAARRTRPDFILIETSGIADPWALAQVAGTVPGIALDCVLTVVDAAEPMPDAAVEFLLRRQVSAADIVLVNKIDLAGAGQADAVADRVAQLAPRAQVLRTVACAIPHGIVFDRAGNRVDHKAHDTGPAASDALFASATLAARAPLDRSALERCLAALPDGVLRAKGVLRLAGNPESTELLQAVGRRWSWEKAVAAQQAGRIVVIGLAATIGSEEFAAHFEAAGLEPA